MLCYGSGQKRMYRILSWPIFSCQREKRAPYKLPYQDIFRFKNVFAGNGFQGPGIGKSNNWTWSATAGDRTERTFVAESVLLLQLLLR